jgi:hypothetical protein
MADPKEIIKKIDDGSLTYDEQLMLLSQVEQTIKEQQQQKDEELQLKADYVIEAFNKIKSDLEKRINEFEVKEPLQGLKGDKGDKGERGDDGYQGRDGKDGKDGVNGVDGIDGVGVADAHIDFDGTLVITLTNGKEITAGDVVPLDLSEKLKIFYNTSPSSSGGGGTIAAQDADAVDITGGSIAGITLSGVTVDSTAPYIDWAGSAAPSYTEGRLWYDSSQHLLTFFSDVSTAPVHIGHDLQIRVVNNTGSTIANGAPVYITSTSSGQYYPNIALAKADVSATSAVIGLTNGAIANGAVGYVSASGIIENVNTGTFTVGDVLYLSPYSAGQLMNTVPPTGVAIMVGKVTYVNSSTGRIYVKQTAPLAVAASTLTGTVAIANGGTGAATASAARTALGAAGLSDVQTFTVAQRGGVTALTDGTTITPDFAAANNYSVTLGGNRTLANPTNLVAGQSGIIKISQDGTGSRTLAFGSYWKFSAGTAPTLTTTASAVDILAYYVDSSTTITAKLLTDRK